MKWVQLCSSLSILWRCPSLLLEWQLAFPRPVATAEFSIFAGHIECSTFTASTVRIWNRSTGIPSPPLTLLIVVFLKTHLTLHSKLPDSRWGLTSLQLCGSLGSFLYSSSVYSCHLFLISFASASPYCFCPLFCPSLHEIFPLISQIFLKRSLVFPFLLSSLLHCSL